MNVQIMKPGRSLWKDRANPPPAEAIAAATGYVAYLGKYEVHATEGYVVHLPEMSLEPSYIGSQQKRYFKFEGDQLRLVPPPFKSQSGELIERTLIWKKVY